jgi:hypothetical protein
LTTTSKGLFLMGTSPTFTCTRYSPATLGVYATEYLSLSKIKGEKRRKVEGELREIDELDRREGRRRERYNPSLLSLTLAGWLSKLFLGTN